MLRKALATTAAFAFFAMPLAAQAAAAPAHNMGEEVTMTGQAMEDALNPRLRAGHLSPRRFRLRPWPPRA